MARRENRFARPLKLLLVWLTVGNVVLILYGTWQYVRSAGSKNPIFPWIHPSPAQDVLSYKIEKFMSGFDKQKTLYQGLASPSTNDLWHKLERYRVVRVPKTELHETLPNVGAAVVEDGSYVGELDVLHQLYCLNIVRKAYHVFHNLTDGESHTIDIKSVESCIDGLRQSLMCNADLSPIVFQWDEEKQSSWPSADVVHTCRNFDKLREWAKAKSIDSNFITQHE